MEKSGIPKLQSPFGGTETLLPVPFDGAFGSSVQSLAASSNSSGVPSNAAESRRNLRLFSDSLAFMLSGEAVDEVLARYLVMPLNSPPHYPPYNGGMECAVRELKTPLREKILACGLIAESQVQA